VTVSSGCISTCERHNDYYFDEVNFVVFMLVLCVCVDDFLILTSVSRMCDHRFDMEGGERMHCVFLTSSLKLFHAFFPWQNTFL